jgi:N4-gp56 family major capsid protein
MGLGTNNVITTEVTQFIPELWSDEVVAAYKQNLVAAPLVRKLNHRGKKGDTIKIPTPARGSASAKAAENQVTLIDHGADTSLSVLIDQHKEYSRFIEDLVDVQAIESLRAFYTDDGGYAIAKDVDTEILKELLNKSGATLVHTVGTNSFDHSASTYPTIYEGDGTTWDEAGNTAITDAGIRAFARILDEGDVPMAGRYGVVHPQTKEDLMGISRFTEQAFVGEGKSIRNGIFADTYGIEWYVTNNIPRIEDSGDVVDGVLSYVFQSDALVLVEQSGVRSQTQYKQEWLADLFTVDMIYGVKLIRDGSVVPVVTPFA